MGVLSQQQSTFLPDLLGRGVLLLQLSQPPAEHPADFFEFRGEGNIFFLHKRAILPQHHEENFQRIYLAGGQPDNRYFLFAWQKTGPGNGLDDIDENAVYLYA